MEINEDGGAVAARQALGELEAPVGQAIPVEAVANHVNGDAIPDVPAAVGDRAAPVVPPVEVAPRVANRAPAAWGRADDPAVFQGRAPPIAFGNRAAPIAPRDEAAAAPVGDAGRVAYMNGAAGVPRAEAVVGQRGHHGQNRYQPYQNHQPNNHRGNRAGRLMQARRRFRNFLTMMDTVAEQFFGPHNNQDDNNQANHGDPGFNPDAGHNNQYLKLVYNSTELLSESRFFASSCMLLLIVSPLATWRRFSLLKIYKEMPSSQPQSLEKSQDNQVILLLLEPLISKLLKTTCFRMILEYPLMNLFEQITITENENMLSEGIICSEKVVSPTLNQMTAELAEFIRGMCAAPSKCLRCLLPKKCTHETLLYCEITKSTGHCRHSFPRINALDQDSTYKPKANQQCIMKMVKRALRISEDSQGQVSIEKVILSYLKNEQYAKRIQSTPLF
ncbi:hypothetical protein QAD02_000454 [Eretmocerus hayati]|uniref:Uncharacterized protein n=1 Tax=Eretmocerus hayati TaxID=131215 RepID=A0ACC2NI17_9HYME|nr:hypothetical protein QAD02_000454 [Eretmocerus hayati]